MLSPQAGDDAPPSGSEAWWALDAAHGWPALPGVELSAWTPQQLSLQRLHAFSVKKGCYPGQEIVARTHFLGRAKRGLASFASARAVAGDAVVDETGREVGTVIARVGERTLAVLPLEHGVLLHDDQPIRELPLADGLER